MRNRNELIRELKGLLVGEKPDYCVRRDGRFYQPEDLNVFGTPCLTPKPDAKYSLDPPDRPHQVYKISGVEVYF